MPVPQSSRARRFSLPDLADDRVEASISAFLSGPQRHRGRPEDPAAPPDAMPFGGLATRMAWLEALRRESARNLRYRRPVAVIVVIASPRSPGTAGRLGRLAGPIAHAIHRGLRETDLVTRTGDARFHVLLPETTGREATRVAERIRADCGVWLEAMDAPVTIRVAAAGTTADTTLEQALEKAVAAAGG